MSYKLQTVKKFLKIGYGEETFFKKFLPPHIDSEPLL